jgi:diguanylate cyclase (GGDEF)-like protein
MGKLSLYVLGSFQVLLTDEILTKRFRTAKERALLATLAVESDRIHTREALAELLWPDRPEGVARTNLRQALSGVRRTVGDREAVTPLLLVNDDSVQLNPEYDLWLDASTFEAHIQATLTHAHKGIESCPVCAQHLEEAISLYRGELLADLHLAGCQRFQEWIVFQREQYHRQMLMALGNLSRYDEQRGFTESALKYARKHVKLAPLEEAAHRQLMQLLLQSNLRSAALEQYLSCRRILFEELGIEPASETTALFEKIRRGTSPLTPSPHPRTPAGDLPHPLTSFINRQEQMDWFEACLSKPNERFLAISGMAGIGKTRLALEVAEANKHHFRDGVIFAALDDAHTLDQVIACIANAAGLPASGVPYPKDALLKHLQPLNALLVIDNFDHLHAYTSLLFDILRRSLSIHLLVTSRRRLNFQSVSSLQLGGLEYPQSYGSLITPQAFSALQLFVERAAHSRPGFEVTPEVLPHIVRICQLVDGHPLALELAAAALRDYDPQQLAAGLHYDLDILQTNLQDIPEKHRSIHTTLETCWQKLTEEEQDVYRKLAIFDGGFTLQAAQAVAGASPPILTSLVDKCMLCGCTAERFRLQPLLKIHAQGKLTADLSEYKAVKSVHSQYFLELVEQKDLLAADNNSDQRQQLQQEIDANRHNIRSAMVTAAAHGEAHLVELNDKSPDLPTGTDRVVPENGRQDPMQNGASLSMFDPLTGLPNQALFHNRLQFSLALAVREKRQFAVMLLELNGFKSFNNDFSQENGDALLVHVAGRLLACLRESDTLASLDGDQFGLILENLPDSSSAALVAEKIMAELNTPYNLDGSEVYLSSNLGVCLYPHGGSDGSSLLQNAARALEGTKSDGCNGYQLYSPEPLKELG